MKDEEIERARRGLTAQLRRVTDQLIDARAELETALAQNDRLRMRIQDLQQDIREMLEQEGETE